MRRLGTPNQVLASDQVLNHNDSCLKMLSADVD